MHFDKHQRHVSIHQKYYAQVPEKKNSMTDSTMHLLNLTISHKMHAFA